MITTFSQSWKKKRELSKVQADLGLPQHALVLDCKTRWGSTQKMIAQVQEQEKALHQVLSTDRKTAHLIPSWQDIDVLESINKALSPLTDFTDILSGERYVTVSALMPLLHHLVTDILPEDDNDTSLTKDIKRRVCTYIQSKYCDPEISELLHTASFLDPRFKTDYIKDLDVAVVKERLIQEGVEVAKTLDDDSGSVNGNDDRVAQAAQPPATKKRKLGSIFKKAKSRDSDETLTPEERLKAEVEAYSKAAQPDPDSNCLSWWSSECSRYPVLAKLAKKYLCICASSSASERLFSVSGNVVTDKRTCLRHEKVNMLVFLAKNL